MSNNKRQPGFYRVKYLGKPTIAKLTHFKPRYSKLKIRWALCGLVPLLDYDDPELIVTDETPINPEPENPSV